MLLFAHGVGHEAQQGGAGAADAGGRFGGQAAVDPIQAHQENHTINVLRHQGGIGEAQHRGRVVEHQVELAGVGQFAHQISHVGGAEQAGGVGRSAAGGEHAPAVVAGHRLDGLTPVQIRFGEHVGEAGEVIEADAVMHLRLAHVGIHQQHTLPHLRERFGEQHVHQGLAFGGH